MIKFCVNRIMDSLWVTAYVTHKDGTVTILWRTSDSVAREALRQAFGYDLDRALTPRDLERMEAFGETVEEGDEVRGILLWDRGEGGRNKVRASYPVRNPAHKFSYNP